MAIFCCCPNNSIPSSVAQIDTFSIMESQILYFHFTIFLFLAHVLRAALFTLTAEKRMMPNGSCQTAYVVPAGNRHTSDRSRVESCCCRWWFTYLSG